MITIVVEYTYGNEIIYKDETQPVIASPHVAINQKLISNLICNLSMEMNIVFKVRVHSK
jgi:hypothetical protein